MSAVASVLLESPISQRRERRVFVRRLEDWIVSLVLAGMVLIPLAEALLRRTLRAGIPASTSIVQHAVLLVGMLGGAIAAREGRLLALSTLEQTWIPENLRPASRIFTSAVATVVTIFLAAASAQFVLTEREAGKFLFAPLRVWWIELALPLGFIAIALRIWWRSSESWSRRADSAVRSSVSSHLSSLHSAFADGALPRLTPGRPCICDPWRRRPGLV
jgi:TRAP-type C4-dicarboxylate transport system permease small subunit